MSDHIDDIHSKILQIDGQMGKLKSQNIRKSSRQNSPQGSRSNQKPSNERRKDSEYWASMEMDYKEIIKSEIVKLKIDVDDLKVERDIMRSSNLMKSLAVPKDKDGLSRVEQEEIPTRDHSSLKNTQDEITRNNNRYALNNELHKAVLRIDNLAQDVKVLRRDLQNDIEQQKGLFHPDQEQYNAIIRELDAVKRDDENKEDISYQKVLNLESRYCGQIISSRLKSVYEKYDSVSWILRNIAFLSQE